METRANYALIGLFTLLVVAAGFLFVYWFAVSERGQERMTVEIVFRDSVAGLSRGSPVTFNGLRVGDVQSLRLDDDDPSRVVAQIQIMADTPIRADTRAQLEYQGLTGIANISLTGGTPDAPHLTYTPGEPPPEIIAARSDFQDLIQSGRDIARQAADTLERVNALVDENQQTITATISNVEAFSQALSDNAPGIDHFLDQVGQAAERVGPLADSLDELSRSTNAIVSAVDPEVVAQTVRNVEEFTKTLADSRDQIDTIFADASSMADRLNQTSIKFEQTLDSVAAGIEAIDADRINATITNVESFSQMLADNNDQVSQVIANAATLTDNLNTTAQQIDGAVAQVTSLLDAVDREDVTQTLANIREFSGTLADNRENFDAIIQDATRIAGALDPDRLSRIVADAESFTSVLSARSADTDRIIDNVATLTDDLGATRARVDSALDEINGLVAAIDREVLRETLANVSAFSGTLAENRGNLDTVMQDLAGLTRAIDPQQLTGTLDNVERFAQVLGDRSADADQIISNAASISEKLNESADRIDGVLEAAQSFLGTAEDEAGEGLFEDIREAAVAIRTLADNLDARTQEITAGINRFTGPGLQEYRALADDGRRTLQDISRAVRAIERNPQQIIFGGESNVPEYGGARR
ncbi:MAG: outer membrane lipid asymmetry maintenance protein MlaD [Saliniramus fredricksonii]|uniref:ABC-type transporter Mla maintaining outer membrane lipid asymmetry, component MlaD n=1 Tax=Saliniramus fredricksonii TaxID=1653334 RepID=A0A0P7X7A1_9HYPH|nr:MCE family protein [Saliniramus fredricksonii]KPQ10965.1 MAG: outer membrane lipid asymmetry maintenance protein MlaD [Saliniramus fredricksonii]SCC81892.1 ABC-type transporter Mla maintaining outer membrane lipid asymmetry, component MlaD [Saliniramus fredricksonii]